MKGRHEETTKELTELSEKSLSYADRINELNAQQAESAATAEAEKARLQAQIVRFLGPFDSAITGAV